MRTYTGLFTLAVLIALGVMSHSVSHGDEVTGLATFVNGQVADADAVNANFTEVQDSVNDNHQRITALEATTKVRRISFPGQSLNRPSGLGPVDDTDGVRWAHSVTPRVFAALRAPADYDGGDVKLLIVFKKTAVPAGDVDFLVAATSHDAGEALGIGAAQPTTPTDVIGAGAGSLLTQELTIAAAALTKDFWNIRLSRNASTTDTHAHDIVVPFITLEYMAN